LPGLAPVWAAQGTEKGCESGAPRRLTVLGFWGDGSLIAFTIHEPGHGVHWTVVNTQPMCERRALWHLARQGFTAYAPKEKIIRMVRGRKTTCARFIFPRYLFVAIADQWHALFNTVGITRVLMTGDQPSKLPDGWVEDMRARERNGLVSLPKHRFKIGQRVEVGSGLLAGVKGLYQGMTSRQREIVLLETLGRVELAPGLLR